ncbi:hypothetical protein [Halomarina rubra]|uniref:DUF4386 family protein n=1 Tax=Halomarina rubra TaxID=2071873 RepID=A0ABD6ASL2_9EURY|nr:hypothetical protein [Halomarina rubra]
MRTIGSTNSPARFWTPSRVRIAGVAGIAGGVLYALSYLENTLSLFTREENALGFAFIVAVALTSYALLGVALNGFHSTHREEYGRLGGALVALITLSLAMMVLGNATNALFPRLADPNQAGATLGGTIWGLAMFATLILMTGYGVVLWRANVVRLGAGLLMINLVLFIAGLVVFDALGGSVATSIGWLSFGGPLGLAWIVLGRSLLEIHADVPTTTTPA